jgi:Rrf2 family protein
VISQSGLYAIRAAAALARLPDGKRAGARQLADDAGVPASYLIKVLQALVQAGLVASQKGPGGGFRLARHPQEVTLWEVLERIDDPGRRTGCLMGHTRCSDESPCALHERWRTVRSGYCDLLRQTTIAELAAGAADVPEVPFLSTEARRLRRRSHVKVLA